MPPKAKGAKRKGGKKKKDQDQNPPWPERVRLPPEGAKACSYPACPDPAAAPAALKRCGGCGSARYCGPACQRAHYDAGHKPACKAARQAKEEMEAQYERFLHTEWRGRGDPREEIDGKFYYTPSTQPYMLARFKYTQALAAIDTPLAFRLALELSLETLWLCRGDNMGARYYVPAFFLRLGTPEMEQACYDFLKYWGIDDADMDSDCWDTTRPFLHIKDADIMEPLFPLPTNLAMAVALVALKHRTLKRLKAAGGTAGAVATLEAQVRALLLNIRRRNAHILPRALGPELARFRRMRPAFYVLGEEDEAAIAVQCLETFLPRWGEREEVVALARALPPPAPGERPDRIQGTDTTFMGVPFVKQYRAPGT